MFKNVLIPTDGSAVANKAVKAGVQLAKELGAKVTGYCAVEAVQPHVYGEGYLITNRILFKAYEQRAREAAATELAAMAKLAAAAGVPFQGVVTVAQTAYEGIIAAAKKHKCDAIFMASHGRGALAGLMLGSVTHKVLAHSKLPVLLYR